MKRSLKVFFISTMLLGASHAHAQIPTTDAIGIAQRTLEHAVELEQMIRQIEELERQYNQARDQFEELKEMNIGNAFMDYILNDPEMYSYIPTDTTAGSWQEMYQNMSGSALEALRSKYGLYAPEVEEQQEYYDFQLTNLHTMEAAYRAHNLRLENLDELRMEAAAAQTPQEKADIANRLAIEQAAINNENNRLAVAVDLMAREDQLKIQQQNANFNALFEDDE